MFGNSLPSSALPTGRLGGASVAGDSTGGGSTGLVLWVVLDRLRDFRDQKDIALENFEEDLSSFILSEAE